MDLIGDCRVRRPRPSTVGSLFEEATKAPDPKSTAAYVAALAEELAAMSRRQKLNTLHYLLDMARLEAERIAGQ